MVEKERIHLDCTVCSGIQTDIGNLKKSDEKQWTMVDLLQTSKASSSQMKWVIGIFLVISIAVVGFLWGAQSSSTDTIVKKIEIMDEKNTSKRDEMNTKLDILTGRFNEMKWSIDEHLKRGDGNLKGKEVVPGR